MRASCGVRRAQPLGSGLAGLRIGLLSAWTSPLGGGVFEAVAAQAALIRSQGGTPVVFGLRDDRTEAAAARLSPSQVHAVRSYGPASFGFAPGLTKRMLAEDLDCLHLNGIWMYPSRAALNWARQTGRPYVISPHGMLDAWILSRGRLKKFVARATYERASWRAAKAFHALTPREAGEISQATGRATDLLIPNVGPNPSPLRELMPGPLVTYIGRIHPKKNLSALVQAWAIARLPSESRLTIAGWGQPEDEEAIRKGIAAGGPGVDFIGPIYGEAKQDLLARSRFLVLPSFGEGLPMALLEAWAAGVPTIATPQCNLPMGFDCGAAIECGTTPAGIAAALEHAFTIDQAQWLARSAAGRALADGPFSARCVGQQWAEAYSSLVGRSFKRDRDEAD